MEASFLIFFFHFFVRLRVFERIHSDDWNILTTEESGHLTMNNEPISGSPTAPVDNPVCVAILMSIDRAQTAGDLHRIAKEDISPGKGMNETERLFLWEAVSRKFSALNAAALEGKSKPRWD